MTGCIVARSRFRLRGQIQSFDIPIKQTAGSTSAK